MTFKEKYGDTAMVAGGSEGMGAAYAHALAARGMDLVLIARREGPLKLTARQIAEQFGVKVMTVICDLTTADAVEQITATTGDIPIDFLVYNAALSYIGPYLATDISAHTNIAKVNMLSPLAMAHYFGGKMVERRKGGIVLMSSIAGSQGSGYLATYAATKAFNRVLAEGLWYEWQPKGVDVIACCAGATATPNYLNTHPCKASILEPKPQTPEQVAEECLRKIGKTPSFVSGTGNKLVSFLMQHIFSRKKAINTMSDGMRKMYGIKD
jgi:short-subunit dehydrogenase